MAACCEFHNRTCTDIEEACCMSCPTWVKPKGLPERLVRCADPDCDHEQADHYANEDESFPGECGYRGDSGGCRCLWFQHPKHRIRPRFAGYCQIGEDGNVSVIALSKADLPDNGIDAVRVYLDENERF